MMTSTISSNGNGYAQQGLPVVNLSPDPADIRDPAFLRAQGLIRSYGIISIDLNNRLKEMARKQGRNVCELIGEMIARSASEVERWEAEQEVARLRERFGNDWMEVLKRAQPEQG